jgi:WD40 repeat protein
MRFKSRSRLPQSEYEQKMPKPPADSSPFDSALLYKLKKGICVAFAPKGKLLALGGSDSIAICDLATGKEVHRCGGLDTNTYLVAFSSDCKRVASVHMPGAVSICDIATGKRQFRLKTFPGDSSGLAFAPKTGEVVHASWEPEIRLWDGRTGKLTRELVLPEDEGYVHSIAFAPDGSALAAVGERCVTLWDWPTGKERISFPAKVDEPHDVAWSPDSSTLGVTGDRCFALFDAGSGKKRKRIAVTGERDGGWIKLAFSPDGQHLVTGGSKVIIWERAKHRPIATHVLDNILDVAISPDGKHLAVPAYKQTYIWTFSALVK